MAERWATFDCYGTIVDWNGGIGGELERLFGVESRERLLARFHEIEPEIQAANPGASYREVLTLALERLAQDEGLMLPEGEASVLAHSLPSWPVFRDAAPALEEARSRGWRLAILSNTDRDLLDASMREIGIPFDASIVAGEIGSYKPATRHWEAFGEQTGVDSEHHVHVAQSLFHDIAAVEPLGIPSIWINRLGEPADARPRTTLTSLTGLADALDEIVPAMTATGSLRAPTDDDVAEVVRLLSETSPDPVADDDVRRAWTAPGFDREQDARLEAGAYVRLEDLGDGRVFIQVAGRPSGAILDWAEERASAIGQRLVSGSWSANEGILRELERRGFGPVRHALRMAIGLAEPTPAPEWPEGIEARSFRPGDERTFYEAQQETFLDSWEPVDATFEEWSHWLLEASWFDPELWFLALDDDEPAGFAICHERGGDPETGSIRLLGVRRPWRRRGLGRALLLHSFAVLREHGFRRAGLGVDAESPTGAHTLYESAGMRVEHRFEIVEKAAP